MAWDALRPRKPKTMHTSGVPPRTDAAIPPGQSGLTRTTIVAAKIPRRAIIIAQVWPRFFSSRSCSVFAFCMADRGWDAIPLQGLPTNGSIFLLAHQKAVVCPQGLPGLSIYPDQHVSSRTPSLQTQACASNTPRTIRPDREKTLNRHLQGMFSAF